MPTQSPPKIGFDTNMLLAIAQLKVDVVSEAKEMFGSKAKLAVPKQVLKELEEIGKRDSKMGKNVEIAMEVMKANSIEAIEIEAFNADQALEEMAKQGYAIATNDSALRKRIKGFAGKVIYLRQRHFLKAD